MKRTISALCMVSLFFLVAIGCKKVVHDGLNSLMDVKNFSANSTCPTGGLMVLTGLDVNRNNVLDSNEVSETKYVCNGQNGLNGQNGTDALSDKQIAILFNWTANTSSTTPVIGPGIIKFSKNNYPGVDSIILVANPGVADPTNTANLTLYNITDSVPIANATITTNQVPVNYYTKYLQTGNLFNQLPDKEITMGLSLYSGTAGMVSATGNAYLILYRK